MALLYMAGGAATWAVDYTPTVGAAVDNSYAFKLRDVSIDGGQPEEIDTTTAADTIAKSYESTPTQDRVTLEVMWEDGTITGSGPAVVNPSYNDMRRTTRHSRQRSSSNYGTAPRSKRSTTA